MVFLTQPWVALGLVQPSVYLTHLDRVHAAVEATGAPFLIRPHPSEDPDLYAGFGVLAATSPAELDPAVTSASYVLGESSTALLNLAAVRGLDAAHVVGPLTERSDMALSTRRTALFRQFVPTSVIVDQLPRLFGTLIEGSIARVGALHHIGDDGVEANSIGCRIATASSTQLIRSCRRLVTAAGVESKCQ